MKKTGIVRYKDQSNNVLEVKVKILGEKTLAGKKYYKVTPISGHGWVWKEAKNVL